MTHYDHMRRQLSGMISRAAYDIGLYAVDLTEEPEAEEECDDDSEEGGDE